MIYIIDELWLSFDELAFLGLHVLAVRLNNAGKAEMVVETRDPQKIIVSVVDDRQFLRSIGFANSEGD